MYRPSVPLHPYSSEQVSEILIVNRFSAGVSFIASATQQPGEPFLGGGNVSQL
ncbi:hypothetical protein CGMCC3_g9999 [Colletotrichum fructicola]|nr:uncharacterized protein CGMCC3_g9999 [Colletotrichum fructicola]KAE9574140.1 hypothetical protein CGMCC3_g9999 [Colletotrichum fructicola]